MTIIIEKRMLKCTYEMLYRRLICKAGIVTVTNEIMIYQVVSNEWNQIYPFTLAFVVPDETLFSE